MKKLMALAVAVAMASVASAASINWAVTAGPAGPGLNLKDYQGATYTETVYLVLSSDVTSIKSVLDAGNTTGFNYLDSATTAVAATGGITARDYASDALTTSATGFQVLLIDTTTGVDNQFAYKFSDVKTVSPSGDPKTPAQFSFAASTNFGGEWTTVAVPEPTSGLLLLLGMAGLALRRKQA